MKGAYVHTKSTPISMITPKLARLSRSIRCLATPFKSSQTGNQSSLSTLADQTKAQEDATGTSIALDPVPLSAYIHLPFCKKKCLYCDFPVIAVGMKPEIIDITDKMTDYVDTLCQEMASTTKLNDTKPLETVFFGGGTPSLLPIAQLERLLKMLDKTYGIALGAEISLEADPGTFTASTLRSYKSLGISRISMGVQSFEPELLSTCGRAHNVDDVYRAIEAMYAADIDNWSLDLMSGLPNLTPDIWTKSLTRAIDAAPKHISVYDLQIEEHTPFAKYYTAGRSPLPNDDVAAEMYCDASLILRGAGYEHYELSNYAQPGYRCKHNMVYWEGRPFYGFGMGAASYLNARRFSRPKRIGAYKSYVNDMLLKGGEDEAARPRSIVPGSDLPREGAEDVLLDTIMLRLRLCDGLDLGLLDDIMVGDGAEAREIVLDAIKEHEERGLVEVVRDDKTRQPIKIRLTDPQGLLLSNDIISDIFAALDVTKQ